MLDVHIFFNKPKQSVCERFKGWPCRVRVSPVRSPWRAHVACAPHVRQCQSFSRTLLPQFWYCQYPRFFPHALMHVHVLKGLALPRASHSSEVALPGSHRLRPTHTCGSANPLSARRLQGNIL